MMQNKKQHTIIYLGYNSFKEHKRGVENVIAFQTKTFQESINIYISFGTSNYVYKWENLVCISLKKNIFRFFVLNFLIFKLKKKKKVIIHSHNYLMSFFLLKKTDLFTVHDALYYQSKALKKRMLFIFKAIEKIVYLKCKSVHFISEFTKSNSLFSINKKNILIPNSSHLELKEGFIRDNNNNKNTLNKIVGKDYILTVRSIEDRARIDLLINVAEISLIKGVKLKYIVAGKGPLLKYYQDLIATKKLDNIFLIGYVSDDKLVQLYKNCKMVLIIADYGEGFGLPIIEGYLFNKPVIASNKCAIPEVIINEKYLFDNNVDSIFDRIIKTSTIKKVDYKSFYNEKYSNVTILNSYKKLYESLMKANKC